VQSCETIRKALVIAFLFPPTLQLRKRAAELQRRRVSLRDRGHGVSR
jgi:hypothetical protein